jgi:predicted RNA binding protein YcfA (HicA-like mRNA interferase family)
MPKLKILSGKDIIRIFIIYVFEILSQKGSHVKLSRKIDKTNQVLVVPDHKELDLGTIKAIYRQASKYISETELMKHFYTN